MKTENFSTFLSDDGDVYAREAENILKFSHTIPESKFNLNRNLNCNLFDAGVEQVYSDSKCDRLNDILGRVEQMRREKRESTEK